ncbi:MAG TPA: 3-isopropylmalate dehydratase large subunit [Casimicrobiaceae bacterium]
MTITDTHLQQTAARNASPRSLFAQIWDDHVIDELGGGVSLMQVDRHVLHECSSAAAFQVLRNARRSVDSPAQTYASQDHILSTAPGRTDISNAAGVEFIHFLRRNCAEYGITLFDVGDPRQGIVHVVAAELGVALPGSTLVCSDSHTATLGAFGALAWGIGSSEAAHVLATQTLTQRKPAPLRIVINGTLGAQVTPKDVILGIIHTFGVTAGVGYAVEYAGSTVAAMTMEGRMTLCNMSIELGARFGLVAPDDTTFEYLHGREYAPRGREWDAALLAWRSLRSTDDAVAFARTLSLDVGTLRPQVSWGTTPGDVIGVDERVPGIDNVSAERRAAMEQSCAYMGLVPGQRLQGLPVDVVFIGSCTNARLSDLRAAAAIVDGRKVASGVRAMVVPGSTTVRRDAEREGIDRIFTDAGFEWREAGCSMCVAINDDAVPPGARCVSTSNRNFEGRQGPGARTHLASPLTAAASALAGCITDPAMVS